jgi:hypothetical protein
MRRLLVTAVLLAAVAAPASAQANGDPASDVLPLQDAFLPYDPQVPKPIEEALLKLLKQAKEEGYPLRVAIIATKNDLGAVPQFFGTPQPYAQFLQSEITFNNKTRPLLIVQPAGYGTANAGPKAAEALEGLDKPDPESGDSFGRAAIEATLKLAEANGHPLQRPNLPPPADDAGGGGTNVIVFLVPVLLLALGGGLAALRARQSQDAPREKAAP